MNLMCLMDRFWCIFVIKVPNKISFLGQHVMGDWLSQYNLDDKLSHHSILSPKLTAVGIDSIKKKINLLYLINLITISISMS